MEKYSFFIMTFGCSANSADSNFMEKILLDNGFKKAKNKEDCDFLIINSCTVKTPTELKIISEIKKNKNKKIILSGCLVHHKLEELKKMFPNISMIGVEDVHKIAVISKEVLLGKKIISVSNIKRTKICAKKSLINIIPISSGCLGNCAYCSSKIARGKLFSYPKNEIISKIKTAVELGSKEIWLTSQDTGCYGFDIGTDLAELLNEITEIKGNFFVRVGMMNPKHAKKILKNLVKAYKSEKIFKFLHLPVQSGSNKILKKMNRGYTVSDFKRVVSEFKKNYPKLNLAVDIIAGLPGETEEDFQKTMGLIEKIKPDSIYASKFWKREGTTAFNMEQVEGSVIKERSKKIQELFHKISLLKNEKWIGWEGEVLIDAKTKNNFIGRNYAYKQFILDKGKIGETVKVKAKSAGIFYIRGERID